MKILFISNIVTGKLGNFSIPNIIAAQNLEYEFHFAANFSKVDKNIIREEEQKYSIKLHQIDFERNPFDKKNYKAYKQLLSLMKDNEYEVVHCNTPIGGILGRICAKQAKVRKVIYTAHGFHFYKGSPVINNIVYKNVERFLAKITDTIITMNKEDYEQAKQFKLRNKGNVYYVPGVGIDTESYVSKEYEKNNLRELLNLKQDNIVLISMGDLIKRKNYEASIRAIAKCGNKNIHFLICGKGPILDNLKNLSKELGIENQIHFLGYRRDIKDLLNISDIFLFTTYQEGLPRSMMEAMATGLPCIASRIRGNVDLLEEFNGGYLVNPDDIECIAIHINELANNEDLRKKLGEYNKQRIKQFDINVIKDEIKKIYNIELI